MSNQINGDELHTISFDKIYPSDNSWYAMNDSDKLLSTDSTNCCDNMCLWWFFHSSPGLNTYTDDKRYTCICGNCCTWCLECKFKYKCCIKEIGCCCFTILFE